MPPSTLGLWPRGPKGVVAVPNGKPGSALAITASTACWTLPLPFLTALALTKGWEVLPTLFEMVKYLIEKVLAPIGEEEVYSIQLQMGLPFRRMGQWGDDRAGPFG